MAGQAERRHSPSRTMNRSRRENKSNSTCWGMRMDEGQQVMEYSEEVTFPDSDEEGSSLVDVSEKTKQFIHSKFTVSVPNEKRK